MFAWLDFEEKLFFSYFFFFLIWFDLMMWGGGFLRQSSEVEFLFWIGIENEITKSLYIPFFFPSDIWLIKEPKVGWVRGIATRISSRSQLEGKLLLFLFPWTDLFPTITSHKYTIEAQMRLQDTICCTKHGLSWLHTFLTTILPWVLLVYLSPGWVGFFDPPPSQHWDQLHSLHKPSPRPPPPPPLPLYRVCNKSISYFCWTGQLD